MVFGKVNEKFDAEAAGFDAAMEHLIPFYHEFLAALAAALPFEQQDAFTVIDLGCGTGGIGVEILRRYPKARLVCVDFSRQMLALTERKLQAMKPATSPVLLKQDLNNFKFTQSYDAIVSSLALHHLENDENKQAFYCQMWEALTPGGVYLNAENVLAENQGMQQIYLQKWHDFMAKSYAETEIQQKWLAGYYEDDRPITLLKHFNMLAAAGFEQLDVICKYYNFALLYARKAKHGS